LAKRWGGKARSLDGATLLIRKEGGQTWGRGFEQCRHHKSRKTPERGRFGVKKGVSSGGGSEGGWPLLNEPRRG